MSSLLKILLLLYLGLQAAFSYAQPKNSFASLDSVQKQKFLLQRAKRMLYGVNGTELNYAKAHKIFVALARQGNADAMFNAGMMYKKGMGCTKNERLAYKYLVTSALKGNGQAAYNVGLMCKYSDSIPQNYKHSAAWIKRAVEFGFKGAHYTLGYNYYKGLGLTQSYALAVEQFQLAANSKDAAGTFMLGYCYMNGYGIERDVQKGKHFIKKAAKMGNDVALTFMENVDDPDSYTEVKVKKAKKSKITKSTSQAERIDRYIPSKRIVVSNNVYAQNGKLAAGMRVKNKLTKSNSEAYIPIDSGKIEGTWSGKLVTYDWSQQQITEEKEVQLTLSANGNELSGLWVEDGDEPTEIKARLQDSVWVFEKATLHKNAKEVSPRIGFLRWVQNSEDELLLGNLLLYANKLKEPTRPNMLVLAKVKISSETPQVV